MGESRSAGTYLPPATGRQRARGTARPKKGTRTAALSESRSARVFRYLLALYVAVAVVKIHDAVPFLAALGPAKIVGGLLLVAAYLQISPRELRAFLRSTPFRLVAVILAIMVISVPFSFWPGYSFGFLVNEFSRTLILFVVAAIGLSRPRIRDTVMTTFVAATAYMGLRVVVGGAPEMSGRAFTGLAYDPNESAVLFLSALPLIPVVIRDRSIPAKIGFYGAALTLVAGVVRTGSRTGFLGLIILAAWLVVTSPASKRWVRVAAIGVAAAVFAATASGATWQRLRSITSPTEDYNYNTRDGRVEVWKRGLTYMADRPLVGVGVSAFPIAEGAFGLKEDEGYGIKYSAAHNSFVQIGAELGVFGLLAFLALLWTAGSTCFGPVARRPGPDKLTRRSVGGALIMIVVGSVFLSFAYQPLTYFVLSICVSIGLEDRRTRRQRRARQQAALASAQLSGVRR